MIEVTAISSFSFSCLISSGFDVRLFVFVSKIEKVQYQTILRRTFE